jgi:hypothetical protein
VKAQRLSDSELSHELTEVRISLESIRPYFCHDLEQKRRQLWAEYDRRQQTREGRSADDRQLAGEEMP